MRTGKLQELSPRIVFLALGSGWLKGLRRESLKSFVVNADLSLFDWSASIPSEPYSSIATELRKTRKNP
jgi:hypothetical protein